MKIRTERKKERKVTLTKNNDKRDGQTEKIEKKKMEKEKIEKEKIEKEKKGKEKIEKEKIEKEKIEKEKTEKGNNNGSNVFSLVFFCHLSVDASIMPNNLHPIFPRYRQMFYPNPVPCFIPIKKVSGGYVQRS